MVGGIILGEEGKDDDMGVKTTDLTRRMRWGGSEQGREGGREEGRKGGREGGYLIHVGVGEAFLELR